jgi:hypothetical protein
LITTTTEAVKTTITKAKQASAITTLFDNNNDKFKIATSGILGYCINMAQ